MTDEGYLAKLKPEAEDIESLYSVYVKPEKDMDEVAALKEVKIKEINLVDGRRAQNCMIMLKNLHKSPSEIRQGVQRVEPWLSVGDTLEQLLKFVPTDEEIATIREHENEFDQLGLCEKYFHEISKVKRFGQRLEALNFKRLFADRIAEAQTNISNMTKASKELANSKKLRKVLELTLALGNYLNSGFRGGAYGFKINSLLNLGDTKSGHPSWRGHTLLHYVTELAAKFPEMAGFQDEIATVADAAKISLPALKAEIGFLRKGVSGLKAEVEMRQKEADAVDEFLKLMLPFQAEVTRKFEQLDAQFAEAESSFIATVKLYGEDPKSTTPEDFFGIFSKFRDSFTEAQEDVKTWTARDAQEKERAKKKEADAAAKLAKKVGQKDGQLDDLISVLRSGQIFDDNSKGAEGGGASKEERRERKAKKAAAAAAAAGRDDDA